MAECTAIVLDVQTLKKCYIDERLSAQGEFTYELDSVIQTVKNPNANEHYVNVSLRYKVLN